MVLFITKMYYILKDIEHNFSHILLSKWKDKLKAFKIL